MLNVLNRKWLRSGGCFLNLRRWRKPLRGCQEGRLCSMLKPSVHAPQHSAQDLVHPFFQGYADKFLRGEPVCHEVRRCRCVSGCPLPLIRWRLYFHLWWTFPLLVVLLLKLSSPVLDRRQYEHPRLVYIDLAILMSIKINQRCKRPCLNQYSPIEEFDTGASSHRRIIWFPSPYQLILTQVIHYFMFFIIWLIWQYLSARPFLFPALPVSSLFFKLLFQKQKKDPY